MIEKTTFLCGAGICCLCHDREANLLSFRIIIVDPFFPCFIIIILTVIVSLSLSSLSSSSSIHHHHHRNSIGVLLNHLSLIIFLFSLRVSSSSPLPSSSSLPLNSPCWVSESHKFFVFYLPKPRLPP